MGSAYSDVIIIQKYSDRIQGWDDTNRIRFKHIIFFKIYLKRLKIMKFLLFFSHLTSKFILFTFFIGLDRIRIGHGFSIFGSNKDIINEMDIIFGFRSDSGLDIRIYIGLKYGHIQSINDSSPSLSTQNL